MSLLQSSQSALFQSVRKQYEQIYKGFGRISKYAMSDKNLTPESKGIYAYICSYTGAKSTAYPTVATILKDLSITEKRYHKHMKLLVEQGYISVTREKYKDSKYMHNIYTVEPNPKKYLQQPVSNEEKEICDKVIMHGIQNIGYGTVSQAVMRDTRLSITAKAIYAYFCSYAGNTNAAFPTRDTILYHLNISKKTYYSHYNQLLELGYIKPHTAYNAAKKRNITIYEVNDCCEFRKKSEQTNQSAKNNGGDFSGGKNAGTNTNRFLNINHSNINNTNQSGGKPSKQEKNSQKGLIDYSNKKTDKENLVHTELLKNNGIPQHYSKNKGLMNIAVQLLAEKKNAMLHTKDHSIILSCIAEMAAVDPVNSKFGNMREKFNKFTEINGDFISFNWLPEFEVQYNKSLQSRIVHNIKGYTKTSIANFLNQYEKDLFDDTAKSEASNFDLDEFFRNAGQHGMRYSPENDIIEKHFNDEELENHINRLIAEMRSGK